jgi:hypothetical protein
VQFRADEAQPRLQPHALAAVAWREAGRREVISDILQDGSVLG